MNATDFVYGSELQGRGYVNGTDLIFGFVTIGIALLGLTGASSNTTYNDKEFHRDVRLFILSAVQDILMTIVVFLYNNDQKPSVVAILVNTDGFIFIYAFNTASMMFCNPECRRYLFSKLATRTSSVSPNLASDRVVGSPEKWT
uniref:7TM_GPCR_Srx domain-containing protein n=1 Tax=Steinernema glaseri TaxID=37863 RepID=A0A1I7YJV6_9BILA